MRKLKSTISSLLTLLIFTGLAVFATSCSDNNTDDTPSSGKIKIAVISDTHLMAPSLLINDGVAFQTYLAGDRKMLAESESILKSVVDKLLIEKPNLVLVTGDLTKDGELVSHQLMATYLKKLTDAGIKVVVTPGNHDINNPHAMQFDGTTSSKVASVSTAEFKNIYAQFGYANTYAQDPSSLSYISEPFDNFLVLSIDACEYYKNNSTTCTTAGVIKPETLSWIKSQLAAAKAKGKEVIAIMHHGLIEHYTGQATFFPEYVVEGWQSTSDELINAGLRVVFTGHYHAQDISKKVNETGFVFDIETGSTVTYPSPYRIMTYNNGVLSVETRNVEAISGNNLQGKTFQAYAKDFLVKGLDGQANYMLTNKPYNLDATTAAAIAPYIRNAFVAHYSGDERVSSSEKAAIDQIVKASGSFGSTLNALLMGLWSDTAPADQTVTINLKTGEVSL